MRFREILAGGLKDIWDTIKRVVIPSFIAIGGTISTTGGALFILPKFVKFITNKDDHPAAVYSSFAVMFFTLIISLATRFPPIYRHFNPEHELQRAHQENKAVEEIEREYRCNPTLALLFLSKGVEYWSLANSYASSGFMLLGSYLNAITVIEFLSRQAGSNPHEGNSEYITQVTAVLLAICATSKYGIFSLKKASANAKRIAKGIENGSFPCNKAALITFTVSLFGTIAVPFLGYFSTTNALGKIPLIKLPKQLKHALAIISSVTGTTTHLTTQIPAVYTSLTKQKNHVIYAEKPWWETPSKIIIYGIAGTGDFTATNIGVFTSVDTTSHDVFGIDAKNPGLIVASCIAALSTATLNYFFSVYRGFEDTLMHYHQRHGDSAYLVIPERDIEKGIVQTDPANTASTATQGIFSKSVPVPVTDLEEEDDIALSLSP
jgi:hypothetical protein